MRPSSKYLIAAVVVLLLAAGSRWLGSRRPATGAIIFRNATITTSTGMVQTQVTVAVADGRVVYVGDGRAPSLASLTGARQLDMRSAMVFAAVFDHSVRSPLAGLRHVWAGQLYEGAPGDLVVTVVRPGRSRFRSRLPEPEDVLAAVVDGRYYSADELRHIR